MPSTLPLNSLSPSSAKKLAIFLGALCWLLLLGVALCQDLALEVPIITDYTYFWKGLTLNGFLLSLYWHALRSFRKMDVNFRGLLWRVFITALLCTFGSGITTLSLFILSPSDLEQIRWIKSVFFHIDFGLLSLFLVNAFVGWERMILYNKTKLTQWLWGSFKVLLAVAMISHFFRLTIFDLLFNVPYAVFVIWILALCTNVRWVPLFNFNQKLLAVIQLLIILFCLAFFLTSLNAYYSDELLQLDELYRSIFSSVLFTFVVLYSIVSLLVMLVNLPTSLAFEKKFQELSLFQSLSDAILEGQNEEEVYQILLNSSITTVNADAGWLATYDRKVMLRHGINEDQIRSARFLLKKQGFEGDSIRRFSYSNPFRQRTSYRYRSFLAMPVGSGPNRKKGELVLLKKANNAFDLNMESTIKTFVAQADIAVQNFRLLDQAVESERLKNELDIAQRVQKNLLPRDVHAKEGAFELAAISEAATEVGGDYYDIFRFNEHEYAVIIADVAGKGISAAFNMAQMKGVFQTLVRMRLPPEKFLFNANAALGGCLEKHVFITASYFHINTQTQTIRFSRAGHCPSLYVNRLRQRVDFLESKGLGLGIVRNDSFSKYLNEASLQYAPGDMLVLYTDGLTEAKNPTTEEEYGYERLKQVIEDKQWEPDLQRLSEELMRDIMQFTENRNIDDDFTLLLLKF